jgi:aromatic ring-opening dioxygenase catalytic subunit (LigB family)
MLPSLFVSHGSPQVLIEDSAARDFLRGFAATNEHFMPLFISGSAVAMAQPAGACIRAPAAV